jgi:hypothetical protein
LTSLLDALGAASRPGKACGGRGQETTGAPPQHKALSWRLARSAAMDSGA